MTSICLDLLGNGGGWKKNDKSIPQIKAVKNGDLQYGRVRKKSPTKQRKAWVISSGHAWKKLVHGKHIS